MADAELPQDDRALESMLRDQRNGPPEPGEANPWAFVRRWPDAAVRGRVWPVVSRLLLDADPVVRERAVEFVRGWDDGAALTASRLIEVASQHAELYADQAIEGMTLRYALAFALSNRVTPANGAQIAGLLRELANHELIGGGTASVLGRYEPTFVTEVAPKYGDAQLDWIAEAAGSMALFRRDSLVPFLTALRGLTQATRERLLATVEEYIKRDDVAAKSLARGQGLPIPTKAAPTAASLRSAIGL